MLQLLDNAGASPYCDAVIHSEMVQDHKPHPEGLLKIFDQLGLAPTSAAMVGDSAEDIGAGKAAGCAFSVGITHGFGSREALTNAGADYIVDHLSEILPLVT